MGCAVVGALWMFAPVAYAQDAAQTASVVAPVPGITAETSVLRVGTAVPLKLTEELTTKGKKLRVGQRFHLETYEPVMLNGVVVIPAGSPAVGEVTDVRNKGMWGKSGHLSAHILYVTVNGRQIRLTGTFDDKGVAGGVGAAAVSAVVFLPAGFFMTGTSARVPIGAQVKAFTDEDVPLSINVSQAPLAVSAPAAASAPAVLTPAVAEKPAAGASPN
ncbi:hypothetical protein HZY97_19035 [Sphingomonas sp. R-74633]|nr:hypothetical protein [Sphingomonas sp. R-74633]